MPINTNKREVMQRIVDEARIDELLQIINVLDEQTRREVLKAISKKLDITSKNYHLTQIKRYIQGSDKAIKDWIVKAVADSYASGSNVMYADLRKLSVSPSNTQVVLGLWTADKIRQIDLLSVQKDAINALVSDAYLDFASGMNGLVRGAERQLNEALRRQIRAQEIVGQVTGASMKEIAKEVKTLIGDQGFSVLIDRGGHSWTLDRYSDMLARTHIIKSANEVAIARAVNFGIDHMQVSTHPGSCKICQPYEGKIYSVSGQSDEYPSIGEFPSPIHPHCRHTLMPRPDLDDIEE